MNITTEEEPLINQQITLFEAMKKNEMNQEDLTSLKKSNIKKIKNLKDGDKLHIWIEDSVEPEGGFWWKTTVKVHYKFKCLYQDGFNYNKSDDFPKKAIEFTNYKIKYLS